MLKNSFSFFQLSSSPAFFSARNSRTLYKSMLFCMRLRNEVPCAGGGPFGPNPSNTPNSVICWSDWSRPYDLFRARTARKIRLKLRKFSNPPLRDSRWLGCYCKAGGLPCHALAGTRVGDRPPATNLLAYLQDPLDAAPVAEEVTLALISLRTVVVLPQQGRIPWSHHG